MKAKKIALKYSNLVNKVFSGSDLSVMDRAILQLIWPHIHGMTPDQSRTGKWC